MNVDESELAPSVAEVLGVAEIQYASYMPDLPPAKAEQLIAQAPEFSRYARRSEFKKTAKP